MFDPSQPNTIFIQIASYRDPELADTIDSAIAMADHPGRLSFGIMHQYGPETIHLLDKYRGQSWFRLIEVPWTDVQGAGFARNLSCQLWRGEQWTLQIDAHMQFLKGWDTYLIQRWHRCADKMAVLSTYPPAYTRAADNSIQLTKYDYPFIIKMYNKEFFYKHIPIFQSDVIKFDPGRMPLRTAFVSGGMVFCPGHIIRDVPYIKDIIFIGEEICRAIQLYTYGYNLYSPVNLPIYHRYGKREHTFGKDMQAAGGKLAERYRQMTDESYKIADSILLGRDRRYFGDIRTLDDFQLFAGIDFRLKLFSPNQKLKLEPPFETDYTWVLRVGGAGNLRVDLDAKASSTADTKTNK